MYQPFFQAAIAVDEISLARFCVLCFDELPEFLGIR
jgi:hypothetical protein